MLIAKALAVVSRMSISTCIVQSGVLEPMFINIFSSNVVKVVYCSSIPFNFWIIMATILFVKTR